MKIPKGLKELAAKQGPVTEADVQSLLDNEKLYEEDIQAWQNMGSVGAERFWEDDYFDELVEKMQTPEALAGAKALFDATPQELGEAAVRAAKMEEELANEFEVSRSTVSRWMRGVTKPLPRIRVLLWDCIKKLLGK